MPAPLIIATEPGANYVRDEVKAAGGGVVTLPYGAEGWDGFCKLLDLLERRSAQFSTFSVDTVDELYDGAFRAVCGKLGIEHPEDQKYGRGWDKIKTAFAHGLHRLANVARGRLLVLVSHTKSQVIPTRVKDYEQLQDTLKSHGQGVVHPIVDVMWYLGYEGQKDKDPRIRGDLRQLVLRGGTSVLANSRDRKLRFLPDSIILPEDEMQDWPHVCRAIIAARAAWAGAAAAPAEPTKDAEPPKGEA